MELDIKVVRESIEEILKEAKQGLHVRDISRHIYDKLSGLFEENKLDFEKVLLRVNSVLNNDVKRQNGIFAKVKNPKTKKDKKGVYKLKSVKKEPKREPLGEQIKIFSPEPSPETPVIPTMATTQPLYIGKAGECAVMSELLFRGYNVNSMLVDDGIDIIASKNNVFYYIQVKTSFLNEKNRIYFPTIKQNRFDSYIGTQMRYIIVARCRENKVETNMYFVFNNNDIQRFAFSNLVNSSGGGINIKIEIDERDNIPYIYHDGKRTDIRFHLNNFEF